MVTKRKDIMPFVNEVLIGNGIKEAVTTPTISISEQFRIFFYTTFALEELLGVHEENKVLYKREGNITRVTKDELEEMKQNAYANLLNALYTNDKLSLTPKDYVRGYVEKTVQVEVAKDAKNKPIMEPSKVKNMVYPEPFFEVVAPEKTEEQVEAKVEEPAPAPAATPAKAGKKK